MLTPSPQDNKGQRRRTAMRTSATPSEAAGSSPASSVSTSHDLNALITQRAYERYAEHGYRHGCALEDWLEAEREILSQTPSGVTLS
ncbi:MAG: DUF2934 domain-containing protein [Nitrospira sp.]|nr:DUF2934 domain-containing protein [Nitrospira sp.]